MYYPPFNYSTIYFTLLSLSHFEQTLLVLLLLLLLLRRGCWKFLINVNIRNPESPAELHAFRVYFLGWFCMVEELDFS